MIKAVGLDRARGVGLVQVMPNPRVPLLGVSQDFRRLFSSADAGAIGTSLIAMEGYLAARLVAEAIRRAGTSVGPREVYSALVEKGPFDLGGFVFRFDKTNRTGSTYADMAIIDQRGLLLY